MSEGQEPEVPNVHPERIDLTGIAGACPGAKPVKRIRIALRKLDLDGKLLPRGKP